MASHWSPKKTYQSSNLACPFTCADKDKIQVKAEVLRPSKATLETNKDAIQKYYDTIIFLENRTLAPCPSQHRPSRTSSLASNIAPRLTAVKELLSL